MSDTDLQGQCTRAAGIRDRTPEASEAVVRIGDVKRQIDERQEQTRDPAVGTAAGKVTAALSAAWLLGHGF